MSIPEETPRGGHDLPLLDDPLGRVRRPERLQDVHRAGERRVGGDGQPPGHVANGPGLCRDEHDLGARQELEHLVRADGVEGGEPVEQRYGDAHSGSPSSR
ncbi:hypothetical protein [Nonomuraea sp. NPDC002799]